MSPSDGASLPPLTPTEAMRDPTPHLEQVEAVKNQANMRIIILFRIRRKPVLSLPWIDVMKDYQIISNEYVHKLQNQFTFH